jgi:uncharacterized membrane protein
MKRIVFFTALIVVLVLMSDTSYALARLKASEPAATAWALSISAMTRTAAIAAQSQPPKTEVKKESELKHNIVKYLGYSLFVLIFLAFGSGFFKKKKKYRTIHHALAYSLVGGPILHGILALTLLASGPSQTGE